MANPYLIIGGIAVGIATAGFGILMVPGWVAAAQDASAINDLVSVATVEALASSTGLGYLSTAEMDANADTIGATFTTDSPLLCVTRSGAGDAYAAVALSASGTYFARTHTTRVALPGATPEAALAAVGGLPGGVAMPVLEDNCQTDTPASTVTTMGAVRNVIHTENGVFAVDNSGKLVRAGADGLPHTVAVTGPAASMTFDGASLGRDEAHSLYLSGRYTSETGVQTQAVVKVATDLTSSIVAEAPASSRFVVGSSARGTVFFYQHTGGTGTMWKVTGAGVTQVPMNDQPSVDVDTVRGDSFGNIYYSNRQAPGFTYQVGATGGTWEGGWFVDGFLYRFPSGLLVGPGGAVFGEADPTSPFGPGVVIMLADNTAAPLLDLGDVLGADASQYSMTLSTVDADGNLYGVLTTAGAGSTHVFKLTAAGEFTPIMENDGTQLNLG